MSLVTGLGGLIGLGIAATAAFTLIKVTGDQLNQCKVCGHTEPNRQTMVSHIKRNHPQELRAAHMKMKQARPTQQRLRNTSWVY